jgi:hypothetical protein
MSDYFNKKFAQLFHFKASCMILFETSFLSLRENQLRFATSIISVCLPLFLSVLLLVVLPAYFSFHLYVRMPLLY